VGEGGVPDFSWRVDVFEGWGSDNDVLDFWSEANNAYSGLLF
jgi:hypothetical protein